MDENCALSWNGYNISGDEKSIKHVRHIVNVAGLYDRLFDEHTELSLTFTRSQTKIRALLDQMLEIADAKNNRNPTDQGIRHTLLNLVRDYTS